MARFARLLLLLALVAGCSGVAGQGAAIPEAGQLVTPAGTPLPDDTRHVTLDEYVAEYAASPDKERTEFTEQGFVEGWIASSTDATYGRRAYLLRFRDVAAAGAVADWYHGFVGSNPATFPFDPALGREGAFGQVNEYQDGTGTYAQVVFPAGPYLVVVSATVNQTVSADRARAEALTMAKAQSDVLPRP